MLSRDNCRIYLKVIIIVLIFRKVRILRLVVVQVNRFYGIQEEWHPVPWLCPILRGVRVHSRPLGRAINDGYKRGKYDFKKRDADGTTPCMGKDLGEGPGNASSSSGSYRLKLAWTNQSMSLLFVGFSEWIQGHRSNDTQSISSNETQTEIRTDEENYRIVIYVHRSYFDIDIWSVFR